MGEGGEEIKEIPCFGRGQHRHTANTWYNDFGCTNQLSSDFLSVLCFFFVIFYHMSLQIASIHWGVGRVMKLWS
jgi:hypothetical protein